MSFVVVDDDAMALTVNDAIAVVNDFIDASELVIVGSLCLSGGSGGGTSLFCALFYTHTHTHTHARIKFAMAHCSKVV